MVFVRLPCSMEGDNTVFVLPPAQVTEDFLQTTQAPAIGYLGLYTYAQYFRRYTTHNYLLMWVPHDFKKRSCLTLQIRATPWGPVQNRHFCNPRKCRKVSIDSSHLQSIALYFKVFVSCLGSNRHTCATHAFNL